MTYTLTIPNYLPPSVNSLMFGSVWGRIKKCRECKQMVGTYAALEQIPKAVGRRRVDLRIVLGPRNKVRDKDSTHKAVLDALKTAGLLVDDSPAYCECSPLEQVNGTERATVITLTDLEE